MFLKVLNFRVIKAQGNVVRVGKMIILFCCLLKRFFYQCKFLYFSLLYLFYTAWSHTVFCMLCHLQLICNVCFHLSKWKYNRNEPWFGLIGIKFYYMLCMHIYKLCSLKRGLMHPQAVLLKLKVERGLQKHMWHSCQTYNIVLDHYR